MRLLHVKPIKCSCMLMYLAGLWGKTGSIWKLGSLLPFPKPTNQPCNVRLHEWSRIFPLLNNQANSVDLTIEALCKCLWCDEATTIHLSLLSSLFVHGNPAPNMGNYAACRKGELLIWSKVVKICYRWMDLSNPCSCHSQSLIGRIIPPPFTRQLVQLHAFMDIAGFLVLSFSKVKLEVFISCQIFKNFLAVLRWQRWGFIILRHFFWKIVLWKLFPISIFYQLKKLLYGFVGSIM